MGAWIETDNRRCEQSNHQVAPYVGAWIETSLLLGAMPRVESHPTWVRGLKQRPRITWVSQHKVAPYVGAWIETIKLAFNALTALSHPTWVRGLKHLSLLLLKVFGVRRTLRGCVD